MKEANREIRIFLLWVCKLPQIGILRKGEFRQVVMVTQIFLRQQNLFGETVFISPFTKLPDLFDTRCR